MSEPLLVVRDLTVRAGDQDLLSVPEFTIEEGEVLALIGPNGAGKSTLLRILGLLQTPTTGSLHFHGAPVPLSGPERLALRRRIVTLLQEPLLVDGTVWRNVALGLRLRRRDGDEVAAAVTRWLARLGIFAFRSRSIPTLSGGEAQRVSLARAFALSPSLLLLDEPFSALDPPTREELLGELREILKEEKVTTVFVTHDRNEALAVGERVAVMMGGRVRQVGPPAQVFSTPVDEEVARFVGVETILPGTVVSCQEGLALVRLNDHTLEVAAPARPGEAVLVCLRPEDVTLSPLTEGMRHSSARNQLQGRVRTVVPAGIVARVLLDCSPLGERGVPLVAAVTLPSIRELGLAPGVQVVASFKATAVHLLRRP